MSWFTGTEHKHLVIDAPYDEVLAFFGNPDKFRVALSELETAEKIDENVWKWTLVKKENKGVKFQGVYTVEYTPLENGVKWITRTGNMDSSGRALLLEKNGIVTLDYKETIKIDLPVPKLIVKLFNRIVAAEIEKGIRKFLENGKRELEEG